MNNKGYSKKTILDYVSGNDLDGYSIDELEDNPSFMADVMEYTMDKRMYRLCSDNVKKNHYFVKRIINKFKNDIDFITSIADNYVIEKDDNGLKKAEINILMGNIFDETEDYDLMKYKLAEIAFYEGLTLEIENALADVDKDTKASLGKGFCFISDTYSESKLIKDYCAKRMLDEIFYGNKEYKFEELLHVCFKKYEELEKFGVTNFLLTYVGRIDSELSDYLCQNQELILGVKKELNRVKKGWSDYNNRINKEKINMIWDETYRYQDEHLIFCGINIVKCLDRVMSKLGVLDLLGIKSMKETIEEEIASEMDDDYKRELATLCGEEDLDDFVQVTCPPIAINRFESHMTSYIKDLFKTNIIEEQDPENNYQNEPGKKDRPKCKIIKVDFKPKK